MRPADKKVLIIVENETVPFDSRVWKQAQSLKDDGYQVTVLCPKRKGYTKWHEVLKDIHIYRHPSREGSDLLGFLVEFATALLWEFALSWWIYFRRGFHIIQGCNPPDNIFLVALPFKLFGVKYIFDQHDVNPELYVAKYGRKDLLYRIQVAIEKLTFKAADVVIATNLSYKEIAVTRGGCNPDDVFVVRNGPDTDKFKAVAPQPELKHGKRYLVGYVGTMGSQDGLDILVNVALHIKNLGRRDLHFTCVGSGPMLPELREMVDRNGLSDMVNFTGRVPDETLLAVLSTADVCVNPDRPSEMNDISTMIKIVEYMALGKPIVQFDAKEGRYSAQSASLYADPKDQVPDFAKKVLYLLDHPEERRRMGEFGRQRLEQELAWKYSVEHLRAAYNWALLKTPTALQRRTRISALYTRLYYKCKPFLPRGMRIALRRSHASLRRRAHARVWPIDQSAAATPAGWLGWPGGKRFALVLTHDVEGRKGFGRLQSLMDLESRNGFHSCFNFVPEGEYELTPATRAQLISAGFEVGVHGLQHDDKLYDSKEIFEKRADRINEYLRDWNACGFRSPLMQHRLTWLHRLNVLYDCSTFDTDPFEPEPDGVGTIFPFWVARPDGSGYVELPYTLPQDFTLFVVLQEKDISIWKQKVDWVAANGGMVLLNTHPDYMSFAGVPGQGEYPVSYYEELLLYIREKYDDAFWLARPCDVARFYTATVLRRDTGAGAAELPSHRVVVS